MVSIDVRRSHVTLSQRSDNVTTVGPYYVPLHALRWSQLAQGQM